MKTNCTRVLLVVNPVSGNRDKEPIIHKVKSFHPDVYDLRIFKTTGKDDSLKLQELLESFPADHILTAGGDGTIKLVAELCQGGKQIIGILPAGSANGLATELELPTEIGRALEIAMGTNAIFIDALRIGDSLCLHLADMGLNAELIKNYEDNEVRGKFGYLISTIPTLLQTEIPYHFTLELNGKKLKREAIMVAFTNCKTFGTGAMINPKGVINDGRFEVLVFKKLAVMEILKTLNQQTSPDPDFVEVFSTTIAAVTSERSVQFQIDGEPVERTNELSVSIIPGALRIAVGKRMKKGSDFKKKSNPPY
jgi:diacylglycerol kinase family enzyme